MRQGRLRRIEPGLDRVEVALRQARPGLRHGKQRPPALLGLGERSQPVAQRAVPAESAQLGQAELHEIPGQSGILGGHGVRKRIGQQAGRGVPAGRGAVQGADPVGFQRAQAGPERLGEQVMVAIPASFAVERDDEQVLPLQVVEQPLTVGSIGQRVAQVGGEQIEHRRLEQEPAHAGRLPVQDLLDQIVQDEAVAAGEGVDESGDVLGGRAGGDGQRGQLQSGGPALRSRAERGHVPGRELQGHHSVEERSGLVRGESKIGRSYLDEFRPGSQAGQRQRRIGPGGQGESDLRGQVVEQEGHCVVDLGGIDDVVVVQGQHGRTGAQVEVVDQADQDGLR